MNINLDKKEKALLILGLAFLVIDIILLIDYFIVGTVIGVSAFFIFILATIRKKDFIMRFSKLCLIVFFLFILLNPAPQHWVSQFNRRWMDNRTNLIDPEHSSLSKINNTFQSWFIDEYEANFSEYEGFEDKVRAIDVFMREEVFVYTLDQNNYDGYYDHIPTMDEIIDSEDDKGKYHEDCDGISIMTASFLIFLGFDHTYISEVTYHYHVMVFKDGDDPKTVEGYEKGISLYKGRVLIDNDKQSYYLFNETEMFIPPSRPLTLSIFEILIDGNVWKFDITELFNGELTGFPFVVNYILVFIISILIGAGIIVYVQLGINKRLKANMPKNYGKKIAGIFGLVIFGTFFINNIIAMVALQGGLDLTFLCNPLLIIALITCLLIAEKRFNYR